MHVAYYYKLVTSELTLLSLLISFSESMAQASTMVSSSAPSVYSVQALVLLAEVGVLRFYLR